MRDFAIAENGKIEQRSSDRILDKMCSRSKAKLAMEAVRAGGSGLIGWPLVAG
jgi:hypothetical protein